MRKIFSIVLACFIFFGFLSATVSIQADDYSYYEIIIEDDANLLTKSEEEDLYKIMKPISAYGNVAFKSISYNSSSTSSYIRDYYKKKFGTSSGTVFLIDMDNRNIWIYSDGDIYDVITKSYANVITDNVYTYASYEEYYLCAERAFAQELELLQGKRIPQPMKYISNGFLAIILALLINYLFVMFHSSVRRPNRRELMENISHSFRLEDPRVEFSHQTRRYSPQSSGSSGGGGGGGGGGGSSGGGGGHSF